MHIEFQKSLEELEAAVQQENTVVTTETWWLTHNWSAEVDTKCSEGISENRETVR